MLLLVPEQAKHIPTSGTLHVLFLLPRPLVQVGDFYVFPYTWLTFFPPFTQVTAQAPALWGGKQLPLHPISS